MYINKKVNNKYYGKILNHRINISNTEKENIVTIEVENEVAEYYSYAYNSTSDQLLFDAKFLDKVPYSVRAFMEENKHIWKMLNIKFKPKGK